MKIDYIDGLRLKQAVIAGTRRVIMMQNKLNRINVFPVPDNDTGTNMALTMQSVAEGAISCHDMTIAGMSRCLADSALMGARGNSGAILAQFFQGLAERFTGEHRANPLQFAEAVVQARNSSYDALSEPREGTILTVIHDWAEHIKHNSNNSLDFIDILKEGLNAARTSLKATPEKLKLLAKAGVVDAGAQGFVHILEGIHNFIHSGRLEKVVGFGGEKTKRANIGTTPQDITFQYCTECFITGKKIDRQHLRSKLSKYGNSLIVAGSSEKVRVHIHTNEPEDIFKIAMSYGRVSKQKFDDMRKQQQDADSEHKQAQIALITDSSCDLPPEFMIRNNIQMVPVQLSFGSDNYIDKITITPKEFYRLLEESEHYPKTSQPRPSDYISTYKAILEHYECAVAVHLSGKLSGTLQAAKVAARSMPEDKIKVVDSRNICVGLGLVIEEGKKAIEQGANVDEVIARIHWAADNVKFIIYFDTVEYLIHGGRLNKVKGAVAEKLHLKPILAVDKSGALETIARSIGGKAALRKVMEMVKKEANGKRNLRFAVAHCNTPERADWLYNQIRKEFEVKDIMVVNVSPALGAHAGPGAAGVAFLGT